MCISNASRKRAVGIVLLLMIASLVSCATQATQSVLVHAQDVLTEPLPQLNQCGSGDGTHFTLAAVGDILLHDYIQNTAEKVGYDYLFEKVKPFLASADYTYANFEGTANPAKPLSSYPQFNYNPALAVALKNAGVDVVSTANNHALDTGSTGVDATLDSLDAAGLLYHGTHRRNEESPAYRLLTITAKDGVSVRAGFLSFTFSTNGIPDTYNQVNDLWDNRGRLTQSARDSIANAKAETDLVIVAVHWGEEYQFYPNSGQRQGMEDLADAGADIILGDHPHTLQPVTWLERDGRKILGIYSLGNFIASQQKFQQVSYTQTSLVFYVGFTKLKSGKVEVNGYAYLPVYIEADLRPVPITGGNYAASYDHILAQMRDVEAARAFNLNSKSLQVCNSQRFDETNQILDGDFYDYFYTLGSGKIRKPLNEALAIVGYPIAAVSYEKSGDCKSVTYVLQTERQRLELQSSADWPYRVVGTQIGTEVYKSKYKISEVSRRTNLKGDAIANKRFQAYFERYGGLTVFGYPISEELAEMDMDSGKVKMVQYFERARFEYSPNQAENANPLYKVQLGLLGREYAGIAAQCP